MVSREYVDGFMGKLAEAGVTLDQAEGFVFGKKADVGIKADSMESIMNNPRYARGEYVDPKFTRRLYERIYAKTRRKLGREMDRAQSGKLLVWQGLRNPITGKFRLPVSLGSKAINTQTSTMTPAQANLVSLITKHRNLKSFKGVQRKVNRGSADFEFMGDPTIFNARTSRLTRRGVEDLKKAWKYVHGYSPDDTTIEMLTNRLFGTNAGFDGSPHVFERYTGRGI